MKRILMTLALLAAPGWAQEEPPAQNLVRLKYVDAEAVRQLLRNFNVNMSADQRLKIIALSGKKAAVETAEAAIKQIDVPGSAQKDIDLTVFFVVGRDDPGQGGSIPPDLQSTIAALKQTFPYKTYDLVDVLSLRSRAGSGASTTGQVASNRLTKFSVRSVNLEGDGSMVRIEQLDAGVHVLQTTGEGKSSYVNVSGVHTEIVDVKEGQKLVVGRSSLDGMGRALFLVLIAKVAQ